MVFFYFTLRSLSTYPYDSLYDLYDRITWVYGVVRIGSIYTIYLHGHIPVLSRAQMTANTTTSHLYCLTGAKDEVKGF